MYDQFEYVQEQFLVVVLSGIEGNGTISINENIQIIFDYNCPDGQKINCIKFSLTEEYIEKVLNDFPKEIIHRNYGFPNWNALTSEQIADLFEWDGEIWHLEKAVDAINIATNSVCQKREFLLFDGFRYDNEYYEKPYPKYSNNVQNYSLTTKDIPKIKEIFEKLLEEDRGLLNRNYKKNWWLIGFEYFERHNNSQFIVDQIIDLTISFESLLAKDGENSEIGYRLSQRAAACLYSRYKYDPQEIKKFVKVMYGVRSKIVHGSASLLGPNPKIKVSGQRIHLNNAINILRNIVRIILFDAIMYYSEFSKEEYIETIDSIWYDSSKFKSFIPDEFKEV